MPKSSVHSTVVKAFKGIFQNKKKAAALAVAGI
jgi:hypothetical protein